MWKLISTLCVLTCSTAHADLPPSRVVIAHERPIAALAISADGRIVATGGSDQMVRLWDGRSGALKASFDTPATPMVLALHPDGKRLGVGLWNGTLLLRGIEDGKATVIREAHEENITAVVFSPDGKLLATGSGDDRCKVWNAERGKLLYAIELANDYDINCAAFSPNGKMLALGDGESALRLYQASTGEEIRELVGHDEAISAVAFLDDRHVASGSWDDTIRIWYTDSGKEVKSLPGHTDDVLSLSAGANGARLVSAGADGTVRVWDVATARTIRTFQPKPAATSVAISADGKRVAMACRERLVIEETP